MLRIGLFICAVTCLSCSHLTSESGVEIVNKSIEAHGGHLTFQELESISFNKTTRLYKEDGTLESEAFQTQSFKLIPEYFLTIDWNEEQDMHKISYDRTTTIKRVNNSNVEDLDAIQNALKLALSAEYVFFQPFKLIDNKGQLSFEGMQILRDTIKTSVVRIEYEDDAPSSDVWRYYFDEHYLLVAASVKHNNRISLIENLDFQTYKGILFNQTRKSYFVDSLLQKKQLRAEYHYKILD